MNSFQLMCKFLITFEGNIFCCKMSRNKGTKRKVHTKGRLFPPYSYSRLLKVRATLMLFHVMCGLSVVPAIGNLHSWDCFRECNQLELQVDLKQLAKVALALPGKIPTRTMKKEL